MKGAFWTLWLFQGWIIRGQKEVGMYCTGGHIAQGWNIPGRNVQGRIIQVPHLLAFLMNFWLKNWTLFLYVLQTLLYFDFLIYHLDRFLLLSIYHGKTAVLSCSLRLVFCSSYICMSPFWSEMMFHDVLILKRSFRSEMCFVGELIRIKSYLVPDVVLLLKLLTAIMRKAWV